MRRRLAWLAPLSLVSASAAAILAAVRWWYEHGYGGYGGTEPSPVPLRALVGPIPELFIPAWMFCVALPVAVGSGMAASRHLDDPGVVLLLHVVQWIGIGLLVAGCAIELVACFRYNPGALIPRPPTAGWYRLAIPAVILAGVGQAVTYPAMALLSRPRWLPARPAGIQHRARQV